MLSILKNGVTAFILVSLISGCTSNNVVGVIENKPRAYPSELGLMPFPQKPKPESRTNANMHNYRKKIEEWACDTVILFDSFVTRITENQNVNIPPECIGIVSEKRNYVILD